MIFLWRTVFLHGFCPGRPPLSGTLPHMFRPRACMCVCVSVCKCLCVCVCACVWVSVCAFVGAGRSNTCSFAGGNNPRIPHRREKSYPPFCSLFPGAIIKWDRPINVSSWRAISCRCMFPAWGGTLIGRSHLIVSHGFGDIFFTGKDFGNLYNDA